MAAAISAYKNGIKDILILERDSSLGGILQQRMHNGFGLHKFNEELTGAEYAWKYEKMIIDLKIPYKLNTIVCPIGRFLNVEMEDGKVKSVIGNRCHKGKKYAMDECISPTRTLTTSVTVKGGDMVSVKSDKPLPKDNIIKYMRIINKVCLHPPINIGDTVIKNIDNTGVNIIATKNTNKGL